MITLDANGYMTLYRQVTRRTHNCILYAPFICQNTKYLTKRKLDHMQKYTQSHSRLGRTSGQNDTKATKVRAMNITKNLQ